MTFDPGSFFFREPDPAIKKNITIQKLLCKIYLVFFLVINFLETEGLDREQMLIVISMALKKNKSSSDNHARYVRSIFEKISSVKGYSTPTVTFEEFSKVIIN